jgi:uncharacterized membrane protein YfcA
MIAGIPVSELAFLAVALALAGLATGVLAGLFGVGGGVLIVPVLYEVFRALGVDDSVRTHLCVGTSLAVIIPTSIRSFQSHLKKGAVDMDTLRLWAAPVVIGVIAGSFVAARAPGAALKLVFAAALAVNGAKMLSGQDAWRISPELPGKGVMRLYGLMIGFLSTLMGIGGGLFGNLIMSLHDRPIHRAVATSAGLGVLISIPAAIGYVLAGLPHQAMLPWGSLGFVSLIGFAVVAPMSALTAPLGSRLAHRFSRRRLELLYGLFQWAMAIRFVWATISP